MARIQERPSNESSAGAAPAVLDQAALRAMPPEDYMNEAQLAFFRGLLEARLRDLGYSRTAIVPDPSEEQPIESGDRAFLEEERAIATSIIEHNAEQRAEIDAALKRIDDGSYGYCDETGDPIGLPRLLAYPSAMYTVEVQERHERARKLGEVPGRMGVAAVSDNTEP
jgi:DnaK suppressor protein